MNTMKRRLAEIDRRLAALKRKRQPARPIVVKLDQVPVLDRARVLADAHALRDAEEKRVGHSVALIVVEHRPTDHDIGDRVNTTGGR